MNKTKCDHSFLSRCVLTQNGHVVQIKLEQCIWGDYTELWGWHSRRITGNVLHPGAKLAWKISKPLCRLRQNRNRQCNTGMCVSYSANPWYVVVSHTVSVRLGDCYTCNLWYISTPLVSEWGLLKRLTLIKRRRKTAIVEYICASVEVVDILMALDRCSSINW